MLTNGSVLITGGQDANSQLSTTELYDVASGTWAAKAPMSATRLYHTQTTLQSGKVLVTGGDGTGTQSAAEVFDPASNT